MDWFNIFGLLFMLIIMIPNIIFSIKCKDDFQNLWNNKAVELIEQIGRFACFAFMIINIPGTGFGFSSDEAFPFYLMINFVLLCAYCMIWIICFRKNTIFRALSLSIIPSVIFLFSGIISHSILLTVSAMIFTPCHILISYKNAVMKSH